MDVLTYEDLPKVIDTLFGPGRVHRVVIDEAARIVRYTFLPAAASTHFFISGPWIEPSPRWTPNMLKKIRRAIRRMK